jgi:leader peptidase (prepilin peptidase)/N-methyltransferase
MRRWVLRASSLPLAVVAIVATGVRPELLAVLYLAAVTPWLVATDIRERRLPNRIVVPGIGAGLIACAGEWITDGRPPLLPLVAGAGYAAFLLLLHVIGGMGMGDVKLAAALGLASWTPAVAILSPVVAFLVGGLVAGILLMTGRRHAKIAFGPHLLGGYWVAVALVAVSRLVQTSD